LWHLSVPAAERHPGFGLALGFTLTYLSLIVLIPLAALIERQLVAWRRGVLGPHADERTSGAAHQLRTVRDRGIDQRVVFGMPPRLGAGALSLPGAQPRRSMIDLPFALPTAVAGIALSTLYAPQEWLGPIWSWSGLAGRLCAARHRCRPGVHRAAVVVRTVQPVLADLDRELEEALRRLGGGPACRNTLRVILPPLVPALLTDFASARACIGEYGSVIFS